LTIVGESRVDAHQHFWYYQPERDTWITDDMVTIRRDFLPSDLEPILSAAGLQASVAVQADQSLEETRFLLGLAHEYSFLRGVVGWVDLLAPDLDPTLEALSEDPLLVGMRHVAQAESDDWLAREDVAAGVGRLAGFGLTYDILVYHWQLPAAQTLVDRLPDQPFVVDHLAKPPIRDGALEPWATRMRELSRRPNVWCKLSGMVTEADWRTWGPGDLRPFLDVVLAAFGPERVMFGSDWPVCLLASDYEGVVDALDEAVTSLTPSEREAVFGRTARRFYGLSA
jgi:L-fuconolactonase